MELYGILLAARDMKRQWNPIHKQLRQFSQIFYTPFTHVGSFLVLSTQLPMSLMDGPLP